MYSSDSPFFINLKSTTGKLNLMEFTIFSFEIEKINNTLEHTIKIFLESAPMMIKWSSSADVGKLVMMLC